MDAKMAPFIQLTRFFIVLQVLSTGFGLDPDLENRQIAFNFSLILKKATPSVPSEEMMTTLGARVTSTSAPTLSNAMNATDATDATNATDATDATNATNATDATTASMSTLEPTVNTSEDNPTASFDAATQGDVTSPSSTESMSQTDSPTTVQTPAAMSLTSDKQLPDTDELIQWLTSLFNSTVGFSMVTLLSSKAPSSLGYKVTFNVAELSEKDALGADGQLAQDLQHIALIVSSDSRSYKGNWVVDQQATKQAMDKTIASAKVSLKSVCDLVGPVCQNVNYTCSQKDSGKVMCVHRCELFLQKNQCDKQGFLATGTCMLNEDSEPYCNCGRYLLLDNFFTGDKCLNVSLVVGITAGGCALLLLTCIIAICCLVSKMRKCRAKRSKACSVEHKTYFDPPPADYMDGARPNGRGNGRIAYPPLRGEPRISSDKRCRSILNDDSGQMNSGYQPADGSIPADVDPTQSEAYNTFFPNLEVVDTTLKCAIKRPNVVIRPTDNYSHVRQHGYAEERL